MKRTFFLTIPSALLMILYMSFCSCKKASTDAENILQDQCNKLAALKAHPFTAVIKGAQIDIAADSLNGAFYYWTGPGNFESYTQNNTVTTNADYSNRGWYHVTMSVNGCNDHLDSVYVNVKFPQGTPTCSPTDNSATFSGPLFLGDQSFSFVSFGNVLGGYEAKGNSSNGDINLKFSAYWLTHDFEDGIYYSTSNSSIDYADMDKIYINDVNQGIYWVADPDKPIYISHVNGKQRVTFCGIQFSGDNGGTLYHTTVSAKITQP